MSEAIALKMDMANCASKMMIEVERTFDFVMLLMTHEFLGANQVTS